MDKTMQVHDLATKLKNSPAYDIVMTGMLLAIPEDIRKELELALIRAELELSLLNAETKLRSARVEIDHKRQAVNPQPRPSSAHQKAPMGWKLVGFGGDPSNRRSPRAG